MKLFSSLHYRMSVYVCVCVIERERKRERNRWGKMSVCRKWEREVFSEELKNLSIAFHLFTASLPVTKSLPSLSKDGSQKKKSKLLMKFSFAKTHFTTTPKNSICFIVNQSAKLFVCLRSKFTIMSCFQSFLHKLFAHEQNNAAIAILRSNVESKIYPRNCVFKSASILFF